MVSDGNAARRTIPRVAEPRPEQPAVLAAISGFHVRIRATLERLAEVVQATSAGRPDLAGATAVVAFFEGPLVAHEKLEEQVLLPRIRAHDLTSAQLGILEGATRGHDKMATVQAAVIALLKALVSDGAVDLKGLESQLTLMRSLFDGHLALEEANLFPLAATVLNAVELAEIEEHLRASRL